jgi:histidine triad (HIT) family protein
MFKSNAPASYDCPICLGVKRSESDKTLIRSTDIVYSDDVVTVFINSFFMGKNAGHVIVVPNEHFENIYDLPEAIGHHIFDIAKKCAQAIKTAYSADGITIRQNNEPAGDQHAFHYHLHVFPRYANDGFNEILPAQKRLASPDERQQFANKLKTAFGQ